MKLVYFVFNGFQNNLDLDFKYIFQYLFSKEIRNDKIYIMNGYKRVLEARSD